MAAPKHSDSEAPQAAIAVPADPVTGFLLSRGLQPDIAYLGESAFELGRRVRLAGLELIYRFQQGTLLICDIAAYDESRVSDSSGSSGSSDSSGSSGSSGSSDPTSAPGDFRGAMRTLVSLIHAIERSVPEVEVVEGLVPLTEGHASDVDEQQLGRRLLSVYRQLGAQCEPHDIAGMVQVRYRMRGGPRQGRPVQP